IPPVQGAVRPRPSYRLAVPLDAGERRTPPSFLKYPHSGVSLMPQEFGRRFGPGMNMQLLVNVLEIHAHGIEADSQHLSYLLVHVAFSEKREDLLLAFAELFHAGRDLGLIEESHHLAGNRHGHGGTACLHLFNGGKQLGGDHFLEQIAARPGAQGVEDEVAVVVAGEDEHRQLRQPRFQAGHALDPVHARQIDVHQRHIGLVPGNFLQRLLAGGIGADATEFWRFVQQRRKFLARSAVIFDNRYGGRHAGYLTGVAVGAVAGGSASVSTTRVPPSGRASMQNFPPSSSIRRRMFNNPSASSFSGGALNPLPLSSMTSVSESPPSDARSQISVAWACLTTLWSASLAARNRLCRTSGGMARCGNSTGKSTRQRTPAFWKN